jgi:hypothetical protein
VDGGKASSKGTLNRSDDHRNFSAGNQREAPAEAKAGRRFRLWKVLIRQRFPRNESREE